MHHHRRAGLHGQVGKNPGVHHEDHVGIGRVHRLSDQLPRCLAGQAEQPRRERGHDAEQRLRLPITHRREKAVRCRRDRMEVNAIHAVVLHLELRGGRGAADGGGDAQPAEVCAAVMHAGVVVVAAPVVDQQQSHGVERREGAVAMRPLQSQPSQRPMARQTAT